MSDHYADIMSGGDPSYWRGKLSSLADNEFVAELSDYVGRTARSIPSDDPNVYVGPSKFSGLLSLGFTGQGSPYWTGLIGSEKREEGERLGQFDPSTNEISIGIPSHASITEDKTKVYDPAIGKWVPIKEKARVLASRQKETIIHEGLHRGLKYIRDHPELIPDWSYVHPETGKTITASDILDLGTGDSEYDEEHRLLSSLSQLYFKRSKSPEKVSMATEEFDADFYYDWKTLTPEVRAMYGSFANALDKKIREQQKWVK
jgi:hypothetical protein